MGARRYRRRGRPELAAATRTALFVYASATDAGFEFRAGQGKLEVQGPVGVDPAICEPVVNAIRAHGAEIQRLVRWFASEEAAGRYWAPRPERRVRQ